MKIAPPTKDEAQRICNIRNVENTSEAVYKALPTDDVLAACFARLLLFTVPRKLPNTEEAAWQYYLEGWRPGKPHRHRWAQNWKNNAIYPQ